MTKKENFSSHKAQTDAEDFPDSQAARTRIANRLSPCFCRRDVAGTTALVQAREDILDVDVRFAKTVQVKVTASIALIDGVEARFLLF
jgi:hypothetical protein